MYLAEREGQAKGGSFLSSYLIEIGAKFWKAAPRGEKGKK